MQEKINYEITVTLDRTKLFLLLLAIKYNLDIEYLFALHEELKEKVIYIFYMLANTKTSLPPLASIAAINNLANDICLDADNDFSNMDESIQILMNNIYNKNSNTIKIEAHKTNEKFARLVNQKNKQLKLSIRKSRRNVINDNEGNQLKEVESDDIEGTSEYI